MEGDSQCSVMIRNRPTVAVTDTAARPIPDIVDEKTSCHIQDDDTMCPIFGHERMTQMLIRACIDQLVLGSIYADAGNTLSTLTMDKTNVIDWIIDAEVKMEEANLPTSERWLVIPPKAAGFIQKSDLKNASLSGDAKSIIRSNMSNGRLGEIGGITVYVSNNLAHTGTTYQCIAGHKSAVTFAAQIVKVESLRLQTKFGDAVRGLNVFGFKTLIPTELSQCRLSCNNFLMNRLQPDKRINLMRFINLNLGVLKKVSNVDARIFKRAFSL
jgi:hypothetical protein